MPNHQYIVGIRNKTDKSVRSLAIVDSLESHICEVRAFLHNNATSALAMFPDDWELVYTTFDVHSFECAVPLTTWTKGDK